MIFDLIRSGIKLYEEVDKNRWNPTGLEGDLLFFFKDLKQSIDTKNIKSLSKLISDDYYSSSLVNQNKQQLIDHYQDFFGKVPFFATLSLEFLVCKTPELREEDVYLIVKPTLNVHTFGITWLSGSSPFGTDDRAAILLRKDEGSGLFSILNMESI
jgi:hypothetical protein